ncbi:MAG: peptidylprolyl isomerase [Candidatus Omnitrophica bacterium]|nr:peptidylprolyl isomerase [Candidatus Omnitrophota bacterium]
MLKVFRRKGVAKKVLWVIATIIIISFGFGFGLTRYATNDKMNAAAGKVFGEMIPMKDFRAYAQGARDQAILMHGADAEKILPYLDMNNETWTRIMLVKEAERRKIKATDQDVIAFISSIPFFQRDGSFDKRTYTLIVTNVFRRNDTRDFEESIRDQIKIMKLFRQTVKLTNPTDEDIRKEYELRNKKMQVSYCLIDPKGFEKDAAISDTELKDYFNAHREEFTVPDSVSVEYMTLKLSEKATDDEKADAKKKASEIYKKLIAKKDFAATAQEYGLDVKKTGFFNMESPELAIGWSLELLEQVFAAKKDAVIMPAITPQGIQILKVADKKLAYIPDFDKAKDQVKEKYISEKSLLLAKKKAEELQKTLSAKIAEGKKFEAAAREMSLEVKQTPFFSSGEYIPEIGISENFSSSAATLDKDHALSEVVTTAKGPAIIHWDAIKPFDEKKFEEVKKDFSESLQKEKEVSAMNAVIKEIKASANLVNYLEKNEKQ